MLEKLVGGIIFLIFGIIITCGSIFVTHSLAAGVIGGLFLGAGVLWIIQEIYNNRKK